MFAYSQSPYSTVANSYSRMIGGQKQLSPSISGVKQPGPIGYNVPLSSLRRGEDSISINTGAGDAENDAYDAFVTKSRFDYQNANNFRNMANNEALMQIGPEKRQNFIAGYEAKTGQRFTKSWDENEFLKGVKSNWDKLLAEKTLNSFMRR